MCVAARVALACASKYITEFHSHAAVATISRILRHSALTAIEGNVIAWSNHAFERTRRQRAWLPAVATDPSASPAVLRWWRAAQRDRWALGNLVDRQEEK